MKVKINGSAKFNGNIVPCHGDIEILNRSEKTVYATWTLFDESNNFLASATRNYFIGDKRYSDTELISKVIEDISNYRIGRQNAFSEIKYSID